MCILLLSTSLKHYKVWYKKLSSTVVIMALKACSQCSSQSSISRLVVIIRSKQFIRGKLVEVGVYHHTKQAPGKNPGQ